MWRINKIMNYSITSLNEEKENRGFFLTYLKECEWKSANILYGLLVKGDFFNEDDEVFFLMDDKNIVSFLILAHQDCIPDETLGPWIGFVYTDKNYRGNRCSEKLIRHALKAAESRGYKKVYLATGHFGLYEKYGFVYSESRKDIYNEYSRIYYYNLCDPD
jgi:GNAT superfamily N-acetyltransferase